MSEPYTLNVNDIPLGQVKRVEIDNQPVCVANVDGEIFAVSDHCTHAQIPLSDGFLEGRQVVCPWHGAMFDLKTGCPTAGPASDPLRVYPVTVDGQVISIQKPS